MSSVISVFQKIPMFIRNLIFIFDDAAKNAHSTVISKDSTGTYANDNFLFSRDTENVEFSGTLKIKPSVSTYDYYEEDKF